MMLPALTSSPPNFLTPRCCALESRPFLMEPCPFLCAMVVPQRGRSAGDLVDLDLGVRLAMAGALAVVLATAKLVDDELGAAAVRRDRALDARTLHERRSDLRRGTFAHEQDLGQLDRAADISVDLFDAQHGAGLDAVLLPAGLHDGLFEAGHGSSRATFRKRRTKDRDPGASVKPDDRAGCRPSAQPTHMRVAL